jgi:hypothetical protein
MRKFRPRSWQVHARARGDMLYCGFIDGTYSDERQITEYFARGYRFGMLSKQGRKYIERRAAKRVGRLIRKGNKR